MALISSSGQLFCPFAVCTSVSKPTTSMVLKVADLGGQSQYLSIYLLPQWSIPSLLQYKQAQFQNAYSMATKAGVSFASTVFPKNRSPYCIKKSVTSGRHLGPGTTSNNFKYLGGLKK